MSAAAPVVGIRRQGAVAAVALAGVYLVVFGPGIVLSLRSLGGRAAHAPDGWLDSVAALEWDVFAVAVVWVVVVRSLPRHAPDVAGRLAVRARIPAGRSVVATVGYVAVAAASVWLGDRAVSSLHLTSGTNTQIGHGPGALALGAVASVAAGVTEEITLVALPVALLAHAAGRRPWAVPATLVTMVVLRLLPHLYYGWGSVFVVFWTVGAYAIFRWSGSIWPLVLGHAVYDLVAVAAHTLG